MISDMFVLLTLLDVIPVDSDIRVPVSPALLVPAPQGVKQLVHDHALLLALVVDGHVLLATLTTNLGETAAERKGEKINTLSCFSLQRLHS